MELGTQIGRDTLYKKNKRNEIPKQVAQGQTQQKGGYGEELRRQLETIGDVRREKPIIKAKRVDPVVSDPEQYTEDAIKTAIDNISGNKTIIVIAHRLSTVRNADRILFLEKGKIENEGTHKELIRTNKKYKKLAELQLL